MENLSLTPQQALSLNFLETTGLIPVRVDYGHKRPPGDWNPKAIEGTDHSITLDDLRSGRYNIGALFHGKFVDVDIDNTNPYLMQALDFFLPHTNYIWGRPSKPRSHRAYALFEDFCRTNYGSILRYIKSLEAGIASEDSLSVELRGGDAKSGMFTVLPGSWREDAQEYVEWAEGVDLSTSASYVELDALMKALRLSVAAAIIAPHWQAGQRNDLSLAIAGLLYRIRVASMVSYGIDADEDAPEGAFVISEADAIQLYRAVMLISGDQHGDEFTREQNLKNTWKKMLASDGTRATGGKAVERLIGDAWGAKVVKALYRLLGDSNAAEEIESKLEQFVIWYGPGVVIDLNMVRRGDTKPWMNKQSADASLGGEIMKIGGKRTKLSDLLFSSKMVDRVTGMTFDPGSEEIIVDTPRGKMVNQWAGFATQPATGPVSAEQVEPFLTYLCEVISNGEAGAYEWVLDWLADILQDPGHKPGTSLVVVGEQGAGKSFLGEGIMRPIIGEGHSGSAADINVLVSNFNKVAENKLFLQVDESTTSGSRAAADKLKSIISDKSMLIQPKYIDSYPAPNHMRLLFTSNREGTAVFIDGSAYERRYTVLHVNPKRARDTVWWDGFRAWTEEHLPQIMRYLIDRTYDKRVIRRPHETAAKRVIQLNGLDPEVAFVIERLEAGFPISEAGHEHWFDAFNDHCITEHDRNIDRLMRDAWPNWVRVGALEEDFRRWVRGRGHAVYGRSVHKLASFFCASLPKQLRVSYRDDKKQRNITDRPRFYNIPDKEAIMKNLHTKFGELIDDLQVSIRNLPPIDPNAPADDEGEY